MIQPEIDLAKAEALAIAALFPVFERSEALVIAALLPGSERAEALVIAARFPASARCTDVYTIRTDFVNFPGKPWNSASFNCKDFECR